MGFPGSSVVKDSTCQSVRCRFNPGSEDPLEEGMAPHSSILAWRIPWTKEPGELQSMGSQMVGEYRATKHSTHADLSV